MSPEAVEGSQSTWLVSSLLSLQAATLRLAGAETVAETADVLLQEAAPVTDASTASLWLLDRERSELTFAGGFAHDPSVHDRYARIPLDVDTPGTEVVRTGAPLVYRSSEERDRRWPTTAGTPSISAATAVLPLRVGGHVLGCLALGVREARDFRSDELRVFQALADHCAVALDRARAWEAQRSTTQVLRFLLDASTALMGTVSEEEVIDRLLEVTVPELADWCAYYVPDGRELRRVAVRLIGDDRRQEEALTNRYPLPLRGDGIAATAFRTGTPQVLESVTDRSIAKVGAGSSYEEIMRSIGLRAAMAVPLRFDGHVYGVVSIGSKAAERVFDHSWIAAAAAVCSRVAVALENARLHDRERLSAVTLARAVLPARLPQPEGVRLGACYLPAEDTEVVVGGDWYDAFWLPGHQGLMIGVGDAAGHGVAAASVMAQLRNAARAFAADGADPGELLRRMSVLLGEGEVEHRFATAVYATLDLPDGRLRWASAGHLAPVVRREGQARVLDGAVAAPLGLLERAAEVQEIDLGRGDLLALYTDGVVETRHEPLDLGIERLVQALTDMVDGGLDEASTALVEAATRGQRRRDDCCLLLLGRD